MLLIKGKHPGFAVKTTLTRAMLQSVLWYEEIFKLCSSARKLNLSAGIQTQPSGVFRQNQHRRRTSESVYLSC